MWPLIGIAVTVFLAILGAAFAVGKLFQKVNGLDEKINGVDEKIDNVCKKLDNHMTHDLMDINRKLSSIKTDIDWLKQRQEER